MTVSATAADNTGVVGVQLILDGTNLGAEDTVSPYSFSWNTTTTADGSHVLTALTRDAAGNQATSVPVSVTVGNAPSASIVGQWNAPFELGIVAVNAVLLRTGKILMFEGQYVTSGSRSSGIRPREGSRRSRTRTTTSFVLARRNWRMGEFWLLADTIHRLSARPMPPSSIQARRRGRPRRT